MQGKEKTNNTNLITGTQLYLAMFSLYLFLSFIETTSFMQYLNYNSLNHLTYVLALVVVGKMYLMDGLEINDLVVRTLLLLVAFISWRLSHVNQVFLIMAFIVGAHGVSFKQIIKMFYHLEVILLACVVCFALLGVIKNYVYHPQGRSIRLSLGIIYPTDLSAHILYLLLSHCYLHWKRLNFFYYAGYFAISIMMLLITNGRLSFICEVLLIAACLLAKSAEHGNLAAKMIVVCYWATAPILSLSIFLLSYLYSPYSVALSTINKALSGRLAFGKQAMDKGITVFGQNIHENGLGGEKGMAIFLGHSHQSYFYIDSSYLRLFIMNGAVMGLIILFILIIIGIRATLQHDYAMMVAMFIVGVNCMAEQHLMDISFNPFMLALFALPINIKYLEDIHDNV